MANKWWDSDVESELIAAMRALSAEMPRIILVLKDRPKCECGAEAAGSSKHADWTPKCPADPDA